ALLTPPLYTLSLHDALPISGQNQILGKSGFAGPTNLAYATADVNAGRTPNVVSLAYDNNYFRADSTTAYAIDSELDALVRLGSRSEEHTSELQSRGHLVCRL